MFFYLVLVFVYIEFFFFIYFFWFYEFGVFVLVVFYIELLEGVDMGGFSIIGGGFLYYILEVFFDMLNIVV